VALLGGQRIHIDELAKALDLGSIPFRVLDGLPDQEPRFLRVEDPVDADLACQKRSVQLLLNQKSVRRGSKVRGAVVLETPKPIYVQQLGLRLETLVETQLASTTSRRATRRKTRVIDREVIFAGQRRLGVTEKFVDGVFRLLGRSGQRFILIPAGRREYPFSFHIDLAFAASVHHSRAGEEDHVATEITATLTVPFGQNIVVKAPLTIL
jgi:hypothetical protein